MPGTRCIRAQTDGGNLAGGAPRVVWLTLGADPRSVSVCSAAQRLNQEDRPCHLVWDPLTGDIAQLLPIVRARCDSGRSSELPCRGQAAERLPAARRCAAVGACSLQLDREAKRPPSLLRRAQARGWRKL